MNLNQILKDSNYKLEQFSKEHIETIEKAIFTKEVRGKEQPFIKCLVRNRDIQLKAFSRLLDIMDDLREKCPWDKKQTFESLRHLTIEEVYELGDSILDKDMSEIKKELSQKLDWRQDFQASGIHFQNKKSDYYKLLNWVEAPIVLLKHRGRHIAVTIILPVLLLLSFYFFFE